MANNIEPGLAFSESDCSNVIGEAWARFTGQPPTNGSVAQNWRAPGFFGLTQRRRSHLFKLPIADPVLPAEMGEYPHFQSDMLRQKHSELVSRLLENRFTINATASPTTQKARELADKAEWVLAYACAQIQERTGHDWQRAFAEGQSAYGYGVLHWRVAPELQPGTPDAKYADEVPAGEEDDYQLTEEAVGGDATKGKYRQKAAVVSARSLAMKANAPFPIHVEVVAPDQVAFIDDESDEPGAGLVVHIKEVGIIDYNGKISKDGLKIVPSKGEGGEARLSLQEFDPKTGVAMEQPAPVGSFGSSPSIAGWGQRIAIACIWTRNEYYELVAPTLLSGGSETIVNQTGWVLVKAHQHHYGRAPFVRAYATLEENEWDPALRYRPALDGMYASKASYDYTRALWDRISTQIAVQRYFITQDVNAPPVLQGDEEGDQLLLTRDSAQAQTLPPGQKLEAVGPTDISPAFGKTMEQQGEELEKSAPPTGQTPVSATTQPWNLRIGQVMANAYPSLLLGNEAKALVEMIRNWVELARNDQLGGAIVAPGFNDGQKGSGKVVNRGAPPVSMNPDDWEGIWIDVDIEPTSSAERVTNMQIGQELLNNPIHILTPEMYVSDYLGIQDATGHMKEVDAHWAIQPFMQGLTNQTLAQFYGKQALVGADGVIANGLGQPVDPKQLLAQHGVQPANTGGIAGGANTQGDTAMSPGPLPSPAIPPLPAMPATATMPAQPGMR